MMYRFKPFRLILAAWLACAASGASATEVQRVVSQSGIEAWLLEDHSVAVIAIEFSFDGPGVVDPKGKPGVAHLLSSLLDEGAGPYSGEDFQRRLQSKGITLGFSADRDGFFGSLKTLSKDREEAFELMMLALTQPRLEAAAVERMRRAVMSDISRSLADPDYLSRRAWFATAFPDHPYGEPIIGTHESIAAIDVTELRRMAERGFNTQHLTIGVAGDITPDQLTTALDQIFGTLPKGGTADDIPDVAPRNDGQVVHVPLPTPQSVILAGQRGIKRSDPRWFAAEIMNHVLGGGVFTSRLMNEIRVKRGLTYGVSSYLLSFDHAALIMAGGATANATAGEFIGLLEAEWARMAQDGPDRDDVEAAKAYLTGSFPLRLTSSDGIARLLLQIQRDKLGIDYIEKRAALIDAVTVADVQTIAREILDPKALIFTIVGQPQGVPSIKSSAPP